MPRERRKWTAEEDAALTRAVQEAASNQGSTSPWREVAKSLPTRTNKDCRKRWCNVLDRNITKGAWTEVENERLSSAVDQHGFKWTAVAKVVGTRSPDQCSSHWIQVLNPGIDYSEWKRNEDSAILHGFEEFGRNWVKIANRYLPRRTPLMIKNRYGSLQTSQASSKARKSSKPEYNDASMASNDTSARHVRSRNRSPNESNVAAASDDDDEDDDDDDNDNDDGDYDDEDEDSQMPTFDLGSLPPVHLDSLMATVGDTQGFHIPHHLEQAPDGRYVQHMAHSWMSDFLSGDATNDFQTSTVGPERPPHEFMQQRQNSSSSLPVLHSPSTTLPISAHSLPTTLMDGRSWADYIDLDLDLDMLRSPQDTAMTLGCDGGFSTTTTGEIASLASHGTNHSPPSSSLEQKYHLTLELTCMASKIEQIVSMACTYSETIALQKKPIDSHSTS